jgi:hypothetical protein
MKATNLLVVLAACAFLAACAGSNEIALPEAAPPGEPDWIAGMNSAKLRLAFGTPAFVRKDGDDEMWRYDAPRCKAFFFLYPKDGALQVRHVETMPRGGDIAADEGCLNAIRVSQTPVS